MIRRLPFLLICLVFFFPGTPCLAETADNQPVAISPEELATRLEQDPSLIIADVRGLKSFNRRRIKGARSFPLAQISQWAPRLKPTEWIVFYCACPHDESSTEAAKQLMSQYAHSRAMVLKRGIDGWIAKGYPFVEASPGALKDRAPLKTPQRKL